MVNVISTPENVAAVMVEVAPIPALKTRSHLTWADAFHQAACTPAGAVIPPSADLTLIRYIWGEQYDIQVHENRVWFWEPEVEDDTPLVLAKKHRPAVVAKL